jgi:hypothetical protein
MMPFLKMVSLWIYRGRSLQNHDVENGNAFEEARD